MSEIKEKLAIHIIQSDDKSRALIQPANWATVLHEGEKFGDILAVDEINVPELESKIYGLERENERLRKALEEARDSIKSALPSHFTPDGGWTEILYLAYHKIKQTLEALNERD